MGYIITVKGDTKDYSCELRDPTFDEFALATASITKTTGQADMLTAGKIIIQTCWVEGDQEIKEDAKLLASASIQAATLIDFYDAEIKKK